MAKKTDLSAFAGKDLDEETLEQVAGGAGAEGVKTAGSPSKTVDRPSSLSSSSNAEGKTNGSTAAVKFDGSRSLNASSLFGGEKKAGSSGTPSKKG